MSAESRVPAIPVIRLVTRLPLGTSWLRRLVADARSLAVVLVVLGLTVAVVSWPWLRRDVYWNDVADAPNHLVRIFVVDTALGRGDLYPRWLPDLYLGYGYPLLNFYAPMTYYLTAGLHRLGMTVYGSLQWAGVLAVALGAAGVYVLAMGLSQHERRTTNDESVTRPSSFVWGGLAGRREGALLGAVVYALSPYPFLTNLYVRAAVPEALALGLLPWLLWATRRAWRGESAGVPLLTGLVAVLLLTHNISALIGIGLLGVWLLGLAVPPGLTEFHRHREHQTQLTGSRPVGGWWPAVGRTVGAVLLGLGLSAFFWLPALAESRFVQLNLALGGLYDPLGWLLDPLGVAGRVAKKDYPHTRLGPADLQLIFDYNALGRAVPEKISLGQLVFWLGVVASGAVGRWRRSAGLRDGVAPATLALFWMVLAAGCWFFNTTWSAPLWRHVPLLPLVQFPWRFYGPFALCLGLGVAAAAGSLPQRGLPRWAVRLAAAGLVGLLVFGTLAARPFRAGLEPKHDVDERSVAGMEYNRYGAGTTSGGEFLPRTAQWGEDGNRRGIRVYDDTYPQAGWQAGLVRVLSGEGAATAVYQAPNWLAARIEAATPLRLAVHQLFFPGWRAYVDGRPVPLETTPYQDLIGGSLGIMVVEVPPGTHHVEVRFGPTPPRALGSALAAAAAALAAIWVWRRRVRAGARAVPRPLPLILAVLVAAGAAGCSLAAGQWQARPRLSQPAGGETSLPAPRGATRVALDVAGSVAQGRAETRAPSVSGTGPLSPFVDVRYQEVVGEVRRWLYMHPPGEAAVRLRIPPRAYFQAGLALEPATWEKETGDGVRFILEAEGRFGRRLLLDQHVNPRARGEDRRWVDVWVDLDDLAGQDVRLILRTDLAQDPTYNWAGWANPQVVTWTAAREHPGARHQWQR